ncbi:MAG: bactofilin family protein [Caldicoprobacterales bacterium]
MRKKNSQEKNKAARQPVSADSEAAETKAAGQAANIITKDTRIVGTITTDSKLVVEGEVEGGIDSKNIVVVSGVVCGDIRCNSAEINNARVEGNIEVIDRLQIKSDSKVKGDLCGSDIEVSGSVDGNINASQSVKMYSNASVIGNITSSSISIETGAVLQGSVGINRQKDQA